MPESLKSLVDEWLHLDPNVDTRVEIQSLWDQGNTGELERRLRKRIEFGTAGLRARMEAGWSRMNDLIILQTSQGLSDYVAKMVDNAPARGLVIGHDHRHHSEHWAQLTAHVFVKQGFKVYFLQGLVHTPLVPFSVKALNAACGVMITASHNPKQDNGYKVYWENAVQIIGPHDDGISAAIQRISKACPVPQAVHSSLPTQLFIDLTMEMKKRYFQTLTRLKSNCNRAPISFVNTSMHGVSDPFVKEAFSVFGLLPFIPVEEQRQPDPEFPTVRFPNPEEKGALDLALQKAAREGLGYVLAQDPDADRFAAAEKDASDNWTVFTGDELGSLFAYHTLQQYKRNGQPIDRLAMVASTVSSKMIEAMAAIEGFKFIECLTGFKFIGNTALDLVDQGFEVPFGYEEAIGFMFGSQIRDKDGVAATVVFAELVSSLRAKGQTISNHLEDLYLRYGYFKTNNGYFHCEDPTLINEIFARIRNYHVKENGNRDYPDTLADLKITRVIDLTKGYDSGNPPDYLPSLPLSSGHMIQFRANNATKTESLVLTLRTSGTEPKIKYYLEGTRNNSTSLAPLLSKALVDFSENWVQVKLHNLYGP